MVKFRITYFLLLLSLPFVLSAQSSEQIKEKNQELSNLRNQIVNLENELNTKTKQEKESLEVIQKIDRQHLLLNKSIGQLLIEERKKENEIVSLNEQIKINEDRVEKLKKDYADYVVWIYKHGSDSDIKYLLGSESINQALIRYKYLSYITANHEKLLNELNNAREELINLNKRLANEIKEKENIRIRKSKEQQILSKRKADKEKWIVNLKKDQKSIKREIDEKQKAEIQIKGLIAKLVEAERRRKARLRDAKLNKTGEYVPDYNYDNFTNFASLKGKLDWPVNNGRVVRNFGENLNQKLNTVTLNYGVDIQTRSGTTVYSVAQGYISAIEWIPGYGSVVIITHKNDFRSVYGHISDIHMNEGDQVDAGTVIGQVNESLEGTILHFEIWNERNYQNPNQWLVKK